MKNLYVACLSLFTVLNVAAQAGHNTKKIIAKTKIRSNTTVEMPYNRLIQSAGKVLSFGNANLENHALDVTVLRGNKYVAVEHRYGLVIIDAQANQIVTRWSFADSLQYRNILSTYSGITCFKYAQKDYLVWGAQDGNAGNGFLCLAEVNNGSIKTVSLIPFEAQAPADKAIPNQIAVQFEGGVPSIYVVLNGNNQLKKINGITHQTVWTATTGNAPFGLCLANNKAFITNWGGPLVTDTTLENAGTPWGSVYTDPATGATKQGSVSVIDLTTGKPLNEILVGLHPNAIIKSADQKFIYVSNANSDNISVISTEKQTVIDSIRVGLFADQPLYFGSSPNGLCLHPDGTHLYVANGLDNAIAVIKLGSKLAAKGVGKTEVQGYIPTEAYPSGITSLNNSLYITNLEAKGARVLSEARELQKPGADSLLAFTIHKQLASVSIIPLPSLAKLNAYTQQVKQLNLSYRLIASLSSAPRKNVAPKPVPDRIGEPSVFKHVVYIIKENKTFDQVYGDVKEANSDSSLCVYGNYVTPNQHRLSKTYSLLDNYFASGKSSAEGHQWTDAAMVSDYVEKNIRAWFRSYPHRQEDALVYNKPGFIWNNALDHGKKVRIFGEACKTEYNHKMTWFDIYNNYIKHQPLQLNNVTTIARIRPVIHPYFPDCDNFVFTDQLRAEAFINEWNNYENQSADSMPDLLIVSLPNDHSAGTSPDFPTPEAMVADNDLALGKIIETVTHSRFWDSTVIFVTQDDSQSGWDHVSSYRTTGLVISPYSQLGKTVHTYYNQTSMVRTIEQILGIPPMNIIDATAQPMFSCFTKTKSTATYDFLPNNIPLDQKNKPLAALAGKALYYAKLSKNSAFTELDSGDDEVMNRILWFAAKGDVPYPVFK